MILGMIPEFRAWDKKIKVMRKHKDIFGVGQLPFTRSDLVVMQFTGLKDRHGKKIFEGDIFKFTNNPMREKDIFVVECLQSFFEQKGIDEDKEVPEDYSEIEVIGDIYSNPKLLK